VRTPKKITKAWLGRREACAGQVDDFLQVWPEGAALTRENLQRAGLLCLDLWWFAEKLLTNSQYDDLSEMMEVAWQRYVRGSGSDRRRGNYYRALGLGLADALRLP
jgi:hypothetical protein